MSNHPTQSHITRYMAPPDGRCFVERYSLLVKKRDLRNNFVNMYSVSCFVFDRFLLYRPSEGFSLVLFRNLSDQYCVDYDEKTRSTYRETCIFRLLVSSQPSEVLSGCGFRFDGLFEFRHGFGSDLEFTDKMNELTLTPSSNAFSDNDQLRFTLPIAVLYNNMNYDFSKKLAS